MTVSHLWQRERERDGQSLSHDPEGVSADVQAVRRGTPPESDAGPRDAGRDPPVTCYRPWSAWLTPDGLKQREPRNGEGRSLTLPCGQCVGCRLDRAQEWATRLTHEARCHDGSSFVTLTYADEHLPPGGTLVKRDLQLFMKRLREAVEPHRVRFFGVGEYGERLGRPHYHVLVFGWEFPDRTPWRKSPSGWLTYRSAQLERLWTYGHSEVGTVTVESAGYCARYALKKVLGKGAAEHYRRVDVSTGQVFDLVPEFSLMSRRPGIGAGWFERFGGEAFPDDFVVVAGVKRPVPRYYAKKLAEADPLESEAVGLDRELRARAHADDQTPERLAVREECTELRVKRLVRSMEQEDG